MENKKYLICDCVGSPSLEIITNESAGTSNNSVRFKGKFQEADVQNKNKRMYSYNILEREKIKLESVINDRRLFGELDHPADSIIHLENASHLITKLWWEDKCLMGEGEILPTPAGKILETIIRCNIPVGISSRGVGSGKTGQDGIMIIDESFKLITFDVVADPSTPNAFVGESKKIKEQYVKRNENISNEMKINKNNLTSESVNSTKFVNTNALIGLIRYAFNESTNKITRD